MDGALGIVVVVVAVIVFGWIVNAVYASVDGVFNFLDRAFERRTSRTRQRKARDDDKS